MTRIADPPTCNRCCEPIDPDTLDFFDRIRPGLVPTLCAPCIADKLDVMFVASGLEPLFPERWQVIAPRSEGTPVEVER